MTLTFPELGLAVVLGDFHLEGCVFTDVGCEASETLSTTSTDADQQHVASRLSNHTHDLGH